MPNTRRLALAPWVFLLLSLCALPAHAALPAPVSAALRAAAIPENSVAIVVQEVGASQPALAHGADEPMNPASTIKLLTTYAALDLLGPTFSWKTEAYTNGTLRRDVLHGDLILRGTGDPKLTIEHFWLMLRALRARGLREVRGDLVLDRRYFDLPDHDPANFDNDPMRPYNVGPDALLVNFKTVRFHFVPDVEGRTVKVFAEPSPPQLELSSSLKFVEGNGSCTDWKSKIKAEFRTQGAGTRASFTGQYPASCGENVWNVSLFGHAGFVHGVFQQLWQELGGTLRGGVRSGTAPPTARPVYTAQSPPLADVVRDINKFSNNVMARQLFLSLSGEVLKQPATTQGSIRVIQSWLEQKKLDMPGLALENGSGLSRIERISAQSMAQLLLSAWQSAVMPEFMSSLPVAASDGTMRRRLRFESLTGQAHIKTGSLSGVRSIAGYVLARDGKRYAVVFFINDARAAEGQSAQDELLRWVYEGMALRTGGD
jgi:D-alanyl-D-alanine carboxypeptidase/D-alanyl-D-alanine-endopeptidase (penicillin-binding protein 4)